METLSALIARALEARAHLIPRLEEEGTDALRLFHGVVEGRPGLTLDRYGPILLAQTFREPLEPRELLEIAESAGQVPIYRHRGPGPAPAGLPPPAHPADQVAECREQGQRLQVIGHHRGRDPWLYLDLRAGRRRLRQTPGSRRVLNLFAYTCAAGVAAAALGAEVWNVDFGGWCLTVGRANAELNAIPEARFRLLQEDFFPVIRQLAGLSVKGRAARRGYLRLAPEAFDLAILDPPTRAVSPFGKVDLIADYEALLKPTLLALRPGGALLATHHAPEVPLDEWLGRVDRCARKAGRPLSGVEVLPPEEDFPSFDGAHPLKMAWLHLR